MLEQGGGGGGGCERICTFGMATNISPLPIPKNDQNRALTKEATVRGKDSDAVDFILMIVTMVRRGAA